MDFRAYHFLMDPVFVLNANGGIRYGNPAAFKWLLIEHPASVLNKPLSDFVQFAGTNIQQLSGQLAPLQGVTAAHRDFDVITRRYQGVAKVSFQRLPTADGSFALAVFVRDRAFSEIMYDEGLNNDNATTSANPFANAGASAASVPQTTTPAMAPPLDHSNVNLNPTNSAVLAFDEGTMNANLSTLDMVPYETKVVLASPSLGRALMTKTIRFSVNSVDCSVDPGKLKKGDKVSMDVVQSAALPQFQASGAVIDVLPSGKFEEVRIQLDQVSPRVKQALTDFIKKSQK